MSHGIKLRKIVYILTHHKIKSMTLLLKLFLFHILYACVNKMTPFSSVCVNSQNFKISISIARFYWLWVMDKFAKQFAWFPKDNIGVLPKIGTFNVKVGSSALWNFCYIADLPPRGIICYIAKLPGGRSAMAEGLPYNTGSSIQSPARYLCATAAGSQRGCLCLNWHYDRI